MCEIIFSSVGNLDSKSPTGETCNKSSGGIVTKFRGPGILGLAPRIRSHQLGKLVTSPLAELLQIFGAQESWLLHPGFLLSEIIFSSVGN